MLARIGRKACQPKNNLLADGSIRVVGLAVSRRHDFLAAIIFALLKPFPIHKEISILIHYSCDRCKRDIDVSTDLRYTVTIEIEAALDGPDHELVDDPDHLDDIQELLDSSDDLCSSVFDDEVYQRKQFDLCKDCFRQYIKNPLSRETNTPMGFSKN